MRRTAELPRTPAAAAEARRLLAGSFADALGAEELDRAKLLTTELVNNAVVHGDGEIELRLEIDEHRLLIEVIDQGAGFEHVAREVPFEQLSGRGLFIVDAEASRWGIHEGTTHVWAEVELNGPRLGEEQKP